MTIDILEHEGLVVSVVSKISPKLCGDDDIMQIARMGLLEAVNEYDESRGAFSTFAYMRIRSRVVGEIRYRSYRNHVNMDMSAGIYAAGGKQESEYEQEAAQNAASVASLLEALTDRQAEIIRSYYGIGEEAKTQAEIAESRGVSTSAVWQIVRKSQEKMRKYAQSQKFCFCAE